MGFESMRRLQGRSDVLMTFGVCWHAIKSILDELETTEISAGQTKIKRVAIIQFRMLWIRPLYDERSYRGQKSDCDRTS